MEPPNSDDDHEGFDEAQQGGGDPMMVIDPMTGGVPPAAFSTLTRQKTKVLKQYLNTYYDKLTSDGCTFIASHSKSLEKKMTLGDYEILKVIGRGAFGIIRLCRHVSDVNGDIYAMKSLSKSHLVRRRQVDHVRSERDVLVKARAGTTTATKANPWIVQLVCTFQDSEYLHFVMEFLQGGDLMTWLIKIDIFPENVAKFYIAEIVLAIRQIHLMGYAHRDIKPDNILLDREGHIKIADFGLCKEWAVEEAGDGGGGLSYPTQSGGGAETKRDHWHEVRSRQLMQSAVGSPGYMAPEVIQQKGYGPECDWWSVGVILFEMLCGYPPFFGDDAMQTRHKIVRWKEFLEFPSDRQLSTAAKDLIASLLRDSATRFRFEDIISHRFFAGVNWEHLRSSVAPLRPNVKDVTDTSYFDNFTDDVVPGSDVPLNGGQQQQQAGMQPGIASRTRDEQILFYGFTAKFSKP